MADDANGRALSSGSFCWHMRSLDIEIQKSATLPPTPNDKQNHISQFQVSAWIFVENFPIKISKTVRMVMGCCSEKSFHRLWSSCWRSTNGSAAPQRVVSSGLGVGSWGSRDWSFFFYSTFYRVILDSKESEAENGANNRKEINNLFSRWQLKYF